MLKTDLIKTIDSENTLDARCAYIPENSKMSLNGIWKIKPHKSVYELPEDVLDENMDAEINVPSCVQYYGYDYFQYTNVKYPFPFDPPFTPYNNPVYHYRKKMELKEDGNKKYIVFEGVDSCFYLYVNKCYVGFSQISHKISEFEITDFVVVGKNMIDVFVVKWCAGSYLEDQDKWRFTGIFRDVYILSRPKGHIVDYFIDTKTDGTVAFTYLSGTEVAAISFNGEIQEVGPEKTIFFKVKNPRLWTAETPNLYNLEIFCGNETIKEKVGIREITIENGVFKINGKHIKLKGVNRHDFHPRKGCAVSEEDISADLKLMKEYNINAIRTSHYPSSPYFYRACDALGFYVMSEADIETHGTLTKEGEYGNYWNLIADDPFYHDAIVRRNTENVINNKNRPCIFSWSLGNESGWGSNFYDAAIKVKALDATRLVHYERMEDIQRLDPDAYYQMPLDMVSRMYFPTSWMLDEYLKDTREKRPLVLCEYCHAMGNGPGDLKEYMDAFNSSDRFMGGFIWEWKDHGILYGEGSYKYGGDFNEEHHDDNFCIDGLVGPSLEIKPGIINVKAIYGGKRFVKKKQFDKKQLGLAVGAASVSEDISVFKIRLRDVVYKVEKSTGKLLSVCKNGRELLHSPLCVNIVRAPIDNERFIVPLYEKMGIFRARQECRCITVGTRQNDIICEGKMLASFMSPRLEFKLVYRFFEDGIKIKFSYAISKDVQYLPRVGLSFSVDKSYENVRYLGYGPEECYIDTADYKVKDIYSGTVKEMFTNYIKPQECGSHYDTEWADISGNDGKIEIAADRAFTFSALPYSVDILRKTAHNWELPTPSDTNVFLDIGMRGLGSNSCGPNLSSKYEVPREKEIEFTIKLS